MTSMSSAEISIVSKPAYIFFGAPPAIGAPAGGWYSGTLFLIAGIVFRNAKIDLRSSSVISLNSCHGIGGMIGRPVPMCLPDLIARRNVASSHLPNPDVSGVRFFEYEIPHGPYHWVIVAPAATIH